MQDLKITLVQADQKWEDKQANFANFERLLEDLQETDLIVLPEMFHTGFTMNAEEMAEEMDNSEGLEWLKRMAQNKSTALYTSIIIKEESKFRNRGVFVFPEGTIEFYDKQKSFGLAGEDKVFNAGELEKIVLYKGWKIMLQICYDLRFPELVRNKLVLHQPKYDLLLYVANWPQRRATHWTTLLRARAIENQCYVAGVNRVGIDGKQLSYTGNSVLIDALGNESYLTENEEEVKSFVLKAGELCEIRASLPFLKDQSC